MANAYVTSGKSRSKATDDVVRNVYNDLAYSASCFYKLHDAIKEDFEFEQGEQWDESDVSTLRDAGVKALTINKIKPIIKLLTGIERQSKSDFIASPEGEEDAIKGDIATRLLKSVTKNSSLEMKLSEQFKHGCIGGMSFIEGYIDYTDDLINGDMKFHKIAASNVFPDPNFQEYDMSDSRFLIKVTLDLSQDDLIVLFPDKEKDIKAIENGKIDINALQSVSSSVQTYNYNVESDQIDNDNPEDAYDLVDHYCKKLVDKYYIADPKRGVLKETDTKAQAEEIARQVEGARVIKRKVPSIYLTQVCGQEILYEGTAPTYPNWKGYPIIPYFAELITEEIDKKELAIQGVVRGIKDLQDEFNKRRTQELRHLNSSANSGFDIEKGQLDDQNLNKLKKFGSSPGVVLERKPGTPPLVRISPMPLSQGHAQLAEENAQDLKEASGVNPDLLANDSQSQSGRAILLKQRQGMVMIQEMLDNFSFTKQLVGRFILSQLRELFTVETAMKVVGDAFISETFTVPVTSVLARGLQKTQEADPENQPTEFEQSIMLEYPQNSPQNPAVDPLTNQLLTTVDLDTAFQTISEVLNDSSIGKYDIAIGEGPFAETVRMANFMEISELAKQGIPIPPDVLIQLSAIPDVEKKDILQKMQAVAMAQMQASSQASPSQSTQ